MPIAEEFSCLSVLFIRDDSSQEQARDGLTDQGFVCNNEAVALVCCDKVGLELKDKALSLLVRL